MKKALFLVPIIVVILISLFTVTVTGTDDYVADDNVAYTIGTAAINSADNNYYKLDAVDVVLITNNETQAIAANIRIQPETLNLSSKADFIAFIEFPEGFDFKDILFDTIQCQGAPAINGTISNKTLIVKFDRQSLVNIQTRDKVILTVTGKLKSGATFSGSCIIKVICNRY